jgi:hypothetical protein
MSREWVGAAAAALGLATLLGCGRQPVAEGPRITVRWTGTESGKVDAPASAEWCDTLGLLEIKGVEGDTGIGVAIYPKGVPGPGRYPVLPPEVADTSRPAAAVALRWFAQTSIRGFKADSGAVVLERSPGGTYSGRLEAFAHSVTDYARLTVQGTYRGLMPRPARAGCVPRPTHRDTSAGIH